MTTTEQSSARSALAGRLELELAQSLRVRNGLVTLLQRCARALHRARTVNDVRARMLRDAGSKVEAAAVLEAAAREIACLPASPCDPDRPGNRHQFRVVATAVRQLRQHFDPLIFARLHQHAVATVPDRVVYTMLLDVL